MNEQITIPDGTDFKTIGQPVRRKEDQRLLTGKGRFTDDFSIEGQTYAAMVRSPLRARAHRADRFRQGQGDARRARGVHWRRYPRRRAQTDPALSSAIHQIRHEARRTGRQQPDVHRVRIICSRPTARATSARRWLWWWPRRVSRRWMPPKRSRSNTKSCRSSRTQRTPSSPAPPRCGTRCPTTSSPTRCSATRKRPTAPSPRPITS